MEATEDIPDKPFHLPARNFHDGRGQEEIEKKVRIIYGYYIENYELLPEYEAKLMCFYKWLCSGFLRGFTFGIYKRRYYCPRCCSEIDKFTYNYHPIYHFGCERCRTKKDNNEI